MISRFRRSPAKRMGWAAAAVIAGAIAVAAAGCSMSSGGGSGSGSPRPGASASPRPTGTEGAAHFGDGYLQFGTGKTIVATYVDPMCPFCGQFENANGRMLATLVNDGTITLQLHPLNFLDRMSQGADYSSRASNAVTCVAVQHPAQTLRYLGELFAEQPEEGTTGLTDTQLTSLAEKAGAAGLGDCIKKRPYVGWVTSLTETALNGPIKGADIQRIKGTPTVLVNGHSFGGDFTDPNAVEQFIRSGGQ